MAGDAGPSMLLGKIKGPMKDGVFDVQEKRGVFHVSVAEETPITSYKYVQLKEIGGGGGDAEVLGVRVAGGRAPSGSSIPESINSIVTIVFGDFKPPPVPPDLAQKKYVWIGGHVTTRYNYPELGAARLGCGVDRMAIVIEKGVPADIAKDRFACVETEAPLDPKSKSRAVKAKKVAAIAPDVPAAELRVVLGLP
ncbi:MAG TPA: hypothetical protein VHF22_13130 [Planctomycetota bacterium]|nr:hypothetical protein [Planctomycetota bacterium]